jgi:hypothetical protein
MKYIVELIMPMFKKYKYQGYVHDDYFPIVKEYRLSLMVSNLILFELFCLLLPEKIIVDPLNIL